MRPLTSDRDWRALLSTLWLFLLLNIIFRDIHQFLAPGYMDMVLAGEMFGMAVTDTVLLYGGFAVEVMILMVILSRLLPISLMRWVNCGGVAFTLALILFTPPYDPDDWFFLIVALATLTAITAMSILPMRRLSAA